MRPIQEQPDPEPAELQCEICWTKMEILSKGFPTRYTVYSEEGIMTLDKDDVRVYLAENGYIL